MTASQAIGRLPARIGTFRQLEILIAVAEHGGIAAAASRLHLSQPSASMQLKKLAESVGQPLYEVIGRKVQLTAAGQTVVQHAREVFDCMGRLEMELAELQGMQAGYLRVGVATSAEYFLPHLLGPFYRRYPKIEVDLHIANRATLLERLLANTDDLYVFGGLPEHPRIDREPLGANHLVVIAPRSHPLAVSDSLVWADVADEQFIVREVGAGTRAVVDAHLTRHGLDLKHQMTIASNEGIKHAVLARMGLAVVPAITLDEADAEDLVQLPLAGFPIEEQWHLAWRHQKTFSVVAETFRGYVLSEGRNMLADAITYWENHHRPKLPTR